MSPRRLLRALAAFAALALLALPTSGAAEATVAGSATLHASKPHLIDGGWVKFDGSLTSAGSCAAGREVRLRSVQANP